MRRERREGGEDSPSPKDNATSATKFYHMSLSSDVDEGITCPSRTVCVSNKLSYDVA